MVVLCCFAFIALQDCLIFVDSLLLFLIPGTVVAQTNQQERKQAIAAAIAIASSSPSIFMEKARTYWLLPSTYNTTQLTDQLLCCCCCRCCRLFGKATLRKEKRATPVIIVNSQPQQRTQPPFFGGYFLIAFWPYFFSSFSIDWADLDWLALSRIKATSKQRWLPNKV